MDKDEFSIKHITKPTCFFFFRMNLKHMIISLQEMPCKFCTSRVTIYPNDVSEIIAEIIADDLNHVIPSLLLSEMKERHPKTGY